jgi:hypothetical protein
MRVNSEKARKLVGKHVDPSRRLAPILWVRDSTARRAGLTMFEIFESSTSTLHVEYKKLEDSKRLSFNGAERCVLLDPERSGNSHPKICRRILGEDSSGMLLMTRSVKCTKESCHFFEEELQLVKDHHSFPSNRSRFAPLTKNVNVIVISIGPGEIANLTSAHPA